MIAHRRASKTRIRAVLAAAVAALGGACAAGAAVAQMADLVAVNGKVFTARAAGGLG